MMSHIRLKVYSFFSSEKYLVLKIHSMLLNSPIVMASGMYQIWLCISLWKLM